MKTAINTRIEEAASQREKIEEGSQLQETLVIKDQVSDPIVIVHLEVAQKLTEDHTVDVSLEISSAVKAIDKEGVSMISKERISPHSVRIKAPLTETEGSRAVKTSLDPWYNETDMINFGSEILEQAGLTKAEVRQQFFGQLVELNIVQFCKDHFATLSSGQPLFVAYNVGGLSSPIAQASGSHWIALFIIKIDDHIKLFCKNSFGNQERIQNILKRHFTEGFLAAKTALSSDTVQSIKNIKFDSALDFITHIGHEQTDGSSCGPMTLKNLEIIHKAIKDKTSESMVSFIREFENISFCTQETAIQFRRECEPKRGTLPEVSSLGNKTLLVISDATTAGPEKTVATTTVKQNTSRWYNETDMTTYGEDILEQAGLTKVQIRQQFFGQLVKDNIVKFCKENFTTLGSDKPFYIAYNVGGSADLSTGVTTGSHWIALFIVKIGDHIKIFCKDSLGNQENIQNILKERFTEGLLTAKATLPLDTEQRIKDIKFDAALDFVTHTGHEQEDSSSCGPMTLKNLEIIYKAVKDNIPASLTSLVREFKSISFCSMDQARDLRESYALKEQRQRQEDAIKILKIINNGKDLVPKIAETIPKEVIDEELKPIKDVSLLYHPTDFIHGLLAAHCADETGISAGKSKVKDGDKIVFSEDNPLHKIFKKKNIDINTYIKDWIALEVIDDAQTGYLGIIYINTNSQQLVLGHRSTNFMLSFATRNIIKQSGLQQDIEGVVLGNILMHQAYGYLATAKAVEYINNKTYSGFALSFTGHSLGAWLAQLSIFYCHADLEYTNTKSVSFDGPGVYEMMGRLKASNIKGIETDIDLRKLDITSYFSAPNIVNSANKHIGTVYRLYPDIEKTGPGFLRKIIGSDKQDGIIATYGHDLIYILPLFDPETGYPTECEQVIKWPSITHADFGRESDHSFQNKAGKIVDSVVKALPGGLIGTVSGVLIKLGIKATDAALSKITGKEVTTLGSIAYLTADLINGKIDQEQFWSLHKYLDREKGYDLKKPENHTEIFSVLYKSNYQTKEPTFFKRKVVDHTDRCLKILSDVRVDSIKMINDGYLISKLLKLKEKYNYDEINESLFIVPLHRALIRINDIRDQIKKLVANNNLEKYLSEIIEYNKEVRVPSIDVIASQLPSEQLSDFVGRDALFETINNTYNSNKQLIIIHGLSGSGKSSAALEYGYNYQKVSSKVVRWISAATKPSIESCYRSLAEDLGLGVAHKTAQNIINMVNNAIANKPGFNALFIFDNVESYEDINTYLLNLPNSVKVLITTRVSRLSEKAVDILIEPFSQRDAIKYLEKNNINPNYV